MPPRPINNFAGNNQIPPNNPIQNITNQNQMPVNITHKNSIRHNTMPTKNIAQNYVTQYPMPPRPINNFVAKNHLPNNFVQNQAFNFTQQQPVIVNNPAQNFIQQPLNPFPNSDYFYSTDVMNLCPKIQQCCEVGERYKEEYGTSLGFEYTGECHASYHAGFGDVEGLRHHFACGANVDGIYRFINTVEHLVIIAAKYCNSRWKLIEIFKLLKEYNANFRYVSSNTGKTALHYLYENTSFTRDLNDHIGLQKFHTYMKEAIEVLVKNGCNINAMDNFRHTILSYYLSDRFRHKEYAPIIFFLLKKGANPNIPSRITGVSPYNAPNALFLAVKIGWPIEVLNGLLDYGAKGDIKDHHGENLLVLAAREKQSATIDWILETIPETSTSDFILAAMKLADKKDRNKLSKWKGPEGESRRRLVLENLELKRQLRTKNVSL
ncbi:26605_t:CDS:2 [Dentiscutata erythropus]|uniref:26605_t:CDS:1 n=1 Tax=Dentiscutata erythropus TaxID=1348616 RepID=A0A9N9ETX8_9GLOM|nr:26605_t:CDS:2 [Dentiscutata erythropus]